ncbi:MAG: signal peptidase I [Candidatus Moranbacteria bacterium CG_4_9_14_3_um_filter_40_7]|nr:MAG: signal peptidase I [Candidatus Moranbacteria bacterium CG23_combo_of_CG06-09_8_20_14_all_40_16]PIU80965.1 MAG: signal peptidase I [Candidatus Moranbacteria bacterium CG06_land_8_20_14_3_00_40_12]PJA88033.1 MAG: signal peptidase I [Candidatus Moranbacteria bacterium CG_4_9_14_3_um_filter_40_7]
MDSSQKENWLKKEKNISCGVGGFLLELIKIVLWAFLIIAPVRIFLFQPFFVQGASMEPTFENNQYLIINELGYKKTEVGFPGKGFFSVEPFKKLKRGDVVVFHYPKNRSQFFIKRIIGLSGEKIEIKNNRVTVYNSNNPGGLILDEKDYLPEGIHTSGESVIELKENEYFVMGDNRMFSSDSRSWGPVLDSDIIGKVFLRAWPPNNITIF